MAHPLPTPPTTAISTSGRRLIIGDHSNLSELQQGWTNEKLRIGSPALVDLPLVSRDFPPGPELDAFNRLRPQIEQILNARRVRWEWMALVNRTDFGQREGTSTYFVSTEARSGYAYTWQLAVNDIHVLFRNAGPRFEQYHPDLHVEIMDESLDQTWWTNPVEPDHLLVRHWEIIRRDLVWPILHSSLPAHVLRDFQSMHVLRYGPFPKGDQRNPPTVVVSILPGHPYSEWREAENRVTGALPRYAIRDARCLFVPSRIITSNFVPATADPTEEALRSVHFQDDPPKLHPGDSIGPDYFQFYKEGQPFAGNIGALGGLVRLRDKNTGEILGTYGLTNYHVIRPAIKGFSMSKLPERASGRELAPQEGSDLFRVGREGICLKPGSWSAELGARAHVESPARRKIGMTLAYFNGLKREAEKELRSPDDPNARAVKLWEQRIKLATNFADQKKPEMGTVLLASGFGRRTSSNRRLDWALIRTSAERLLPKNTIRPDRFALSQQFKDALDGMEVVRHGIRGIGDMDRYTKPDPPRVFKLGCQSHGTVGKFLNMKSDVCLAPAHWNLNAGHSQEYCFVGPKTEQETLDKRFAIPGDSGAWVFDAAGDWVGVVFGGQKFNASKPESEHFTYVTPAMDVIRDIEDYLYYDGFEFKVELIGMIDLPHRHHE